MYAYRIAYDGTSYRGFQRQPDVGTVEDTLFDGLRTLGLLGADADKPSGYAAAGRTDAGVSALAQTVAFEAPEWLTPRALNSELPADVRAWARATVPVDFHATHDVASRTYSYHLYAPEADARRAREVAADLEGTHDIHNLTSDDEGTIREISSVSVERDGPFVVVTIRAPGFSRQQVRRMVSLLAEVAHGESGHSRVDEVLSERELSGPEGVPSAPPEPLVLTEVSYPGVEFAIDDEAAESARVVFDQRRIERVVGARVAGELADGIRSNGK